MLLLLTALALADDPAAAEVRAQIDWQGHPAMHIPWQMFGRGLTDRRLTHRTWRHQFRQTVTEPTLDASGIRIFLAAAMAAERARNPRQARRLILKQLAYVEAFVAEHPDRYVLARTPAEARAALATTDKMVIVHSIEGGHHLLWEDGDARFWAEQGVALVTLIHLRDKEFGGSAILGASVGPMINPKGARARRKGERRGLTVRGVAAIVALDEAGILVDYTHMAPEAVDDALRVSAEHGIPPVFTHGVLDTVKDDELAISEAQLVEVYRLGGLFAAGLSALDLEGGGQAPPPPDTCDGTLEMWAWHHQRTQDVLDAHVDVIFAEPGLTPDQLTDAQRTRLATGWSSDWNGWVSHSRPVHGRGRCRPELPDEPLDIDTRGLAHPGLLPEHWQRVEQRGVDLDPMLRSAERFLQLWEEVRGD